MHLLCPGHLGPGALPLRWGDMVCEKEPGCETSVQFPGFLWWLLVLLCCREKGMDVSQLPPGSATLGRRELDSPVLMQLLTSTSNPHCGR